jgi:hypothetical protein
MQLTLRTNNQERQPKPLSKHHKADSSLNLVFDSDQEEKDEPNEKPSSSNKTEDDAPFNEENSKIE